MRTFIFLFCTMVFSFTPENVVSQNSKIKIEKDKTLTVDEVFDLIMNQTDYNFFYEEGIFKDFPNIHVKKGVVRTNKLLKRSLFQGDFEIIISNDYDILIKKKNLNAVNMRQEHKVSGTITDQTGQPLAGANILEKGTTNGTQADFDGNYSISVSNNNAKLMFSYIGFASQEIIVGEQTTINIKLVESASSLDEVVLVGYGSQIKRNVTGSIGSVKGKDIENVITGNAAQALLGRVANVDVEFDGGSPGGGANIVVRGLGSLSNQGPLFVIDGVFSDNMDFLNPADIASVQVLKDASTASIYGARAGQGVVIIATKKGSNNQALKIDLDISLGMAKAVRTIDYLNAEDFVQNRVQAFENDNVPLPGNFYDFDSTVDSDIQDASLRTASVKNYGIRLYGGGEKSTYSIALNRLDQEGVVVNSGFERTSLRVNTTTEKGKFSLNQSLFLSRSIENQNLTLGREFGHVPVSPIFDENNDGGFAATNSGVAGITRSVNLLGLGLLEERKNTNDNLLAHLGASYEIIDGLTYKLNLSMNYSNRRQFVFVPTYFMSNTDVGSNELADIFDSKTNFLSTIVENLLNYKKEFNGHNLDVLAGYSQQRDLTETLATQAEDFFSNDTRTVSAANRILSSVGDKLPRNISSIFGRINYDYKGRYLFSGSLRRDGSSNFGKDNRFGVFPSFSAGWNISEEEFFNPGFLSYLKVRGSWGKLGSDNLIPFQYITALNTTSQYTLGNAQSRLNGVSQTVFSNPNLKWEETVTSNFGIDMRLFDGKMDLSMEYYVKDSKDILASISPNPTSGTSNSIPVNAATIKNTGFEFTTGYRKSKGDFKFLVNANFAILDNEVVSLGEGVGPITGAGSRTEAGFPIGYFYGFKTNGVYQNQAEIDAEGLQERSIAPGDLKFVDINGDGALNDEDRTLIGDPTPDFTYGFNFTGSYKDFDFGLFFQGVGGNQILNLRKQDGVFRPNGNKLGIVRDAWTPSNPSNTIPRASISDAAGNGRTSDFFVENGAYFRLRNVSLGYTIPIGDSTFFSKLRAYLNVENLFTIDDYSGYYPVTGRNDTKQINNTGPTGQADNLFKRGVDVNTYPTARTVTLGLQVSF